MLGLRFCVRAFSSCGKRGPLFIVVRGPLTVTASLLVERRLSQLLWLTGLVAPRHVGSSQTRARTRVPLHWQADSQPLCHQGSPEIRILICTSLPSLQPQFLSSAASTVPHHTHFSLSPGPLSPSRLGLCRPNSRLLSPGLMRKPKSGRLGPKFYGGSGPNGLARNSTSTALYPLGAAKCKQLW